MSKSLGNMIFVHDLLKKYGSDALRLYLLSHHWRYAFNYEEKHLKEAEKLAQELKKTSQSTKMEGKEAKKLLPSFFKALDDDLAIPSAIKILASLAKSNQPRKGELITKCAGEILGLIFPLSV